MAALIEKDIFEKIEKLVANNVIIEIFKVISIDDC